jgi:hypothetical protein
MNNAFVARSMPGFFRGRFIDYPSSGKMHLFKFVRASL